MKPARPELPLVCLLVLAVPLEVWAAATATLPAFNFGHGWPSAVAYVIAAPWVAVLLWRRSGRARMACYIFLTFDVVRSVRLGNVAPVAVDAAAVVHLLTPAMRALYPSMWSRATARRRASAS